MGKVSCHMRLKKLLSLALILTHSLCWILIRLVCSYSRVKRGHKDSQVTELTKYKY